MAAGTGQLRADVQHLTASVSHGPRAPPHHHRPQRAGARRPGHGQLDAVESQHLPQVEASAQLLNQLIDALTQCDRLATLALNTLPLDLATLVSPRRRPLAERSHWHAQCSGNCPDDWPGVVADPVLLRQVWQQLFDSALKFTLQPGVGQLRLDWQRLKVPPNWRFGC
ncbi:MAG: hypothetical protein IPO00_17915 [Betaproteobacteria bacterium]|nr:hypothetical protein [Betaproteobacteria bacterium]